ncbi:MAG: DUF3298 domain-containing protein [Clostridium sp.]|nr:DUF3298 domain-containing protein [Clostridium sp.]
MIYFRYPFKCEYLDCPYNSDVSYNINNNYRSDDSIELKQQKLMPEKLGILYPFIPNPDNKENLTKINNGIINEVSELFRSQVLKPEVIDFNEILGTYEVKLNQNGILSILFSMYTYINKAAHGFTAYVSITVNVETGQIYNFSDLFNGKVCYIIILNELANQYIKDKNISLINEYNGISENQQYYLTPNSLVLYYQVYEYTPYYYGLFKIEIPYDKLKNIQMPGGPISKFL